MRYIKLGQTGHEKERVVMVRYYQDPIYPLPRRSAQTYKNVRIIPQPAAIIIST